jgi:anti-sigma-K factor RskA
MFTEEHVLDSIPAYALDCLDEGEKSRVADHLAACERCRGELQVYQQLVGDLPLAMAESAPPPGLKSRVMQQVKQSRAPAPVERKPTVWERFSQLLRGAAPAWGLASLALIAVLAISNVYLWGRLSSLEEQIQSPFITVDLQGSPAAPGASGVLVFSPDGTQGTLVVADLPALSPVQQYQLWLIRDGKRTSGGVFSVDPHGYYSLVVLSPLPLTNYTAFGVTIEPAGGSPGPTGEKVLGGEL